MTVFSWIVVVGVLVGTFLVWKTLNDPKNGVVSCCGCGQCAHTGECILVRKKAEKERVSS